MNNEEVLKRDMLKTNFFVEEELKKSAMLLRKMSEEEVLVSMILLAKGCSLSGNINGPFSKSKLGNSYSSDICKFKNIKNEWDIGFSIGYFSKDQFFIFFYSTDEKSIDDLLHLFGDSFHESKDKDVDGIIKYMNYNKLIDYVETNLDYIG